jgi:LssY C-terminus
MSSLAVRSRASGRLTCLACILIALSGCATWTTPTETGDTPLRTRAVTEAKPGVRVSAAVLGPEDCVRMLGRDVTADGVQPVWIEVTNETEHVLWLLRSGADPDYFSPLEVAWSAHGTLSPGTNSRIDEHFNQLAFPNPIQVRGTSSGILFTNPQPLTKLLTVDLLGSRMMIPFTLFLPVPGDIAGAKGVVHQYPATEIANFEDLDALRQALAGLPCCAVRTDGHPDGEPLNVVLIGHLDDIVAAINRRGYRRDQSAADASQRLFGRKADLTARRRAQAGASTSWLRIWRAPLSYRGEMVFVAQAGRPIGGRFPAEASQNLRLHADVDEVRNDLIHDFMYSGGLEKLAFVSGVGAVRADRPRTLPGGGRYFTDGRRVALFLSTRPRTFADVEVLDWEPILQERATEAERGVGNAVD